MQQPPVPRRVEMPGTEGQTFVYFAYGSNLLTSRLRNAERAPSAVPIGRAQLHGHQLRFHKPSQDGSSKADAARTGDWADMVEGVLFRVSEADRSCLDFAEGAGSGYEAFEVDVTSALESAGVKALTYIATVDPSGEPPYDWYRNYVLHGSQEHQLPTEYVRKFIESVPAKPDRVGHDQPRPCPHRQNK